MSISGRWISLASVAISAVGMCSAGSQGKATLADYLASHPWDAPHSGPAVVVDADRTVVRTSPNTLLGFDRKVVHIGTLSAIVPTEMVLIDDSLSQTPNMYDGLPLHAKVLYLLSTLSPDQVKLATSDGIGLNDLQAEQRKVFRSLIPPTLAWETYSVGQDGIGPNRIASGTVPADERDQVKIKFASTLIFDMNLANNANAYTGVFSGDYSKPGDKRTLRRDSGDDDNFGVMIRQTMVNEAKPSQLNYMDARFDSSLGLTGKSTIKELLRAASFACGIGIFSDLRVSGLTVNSFGSQARVGDVLKAIALCVTGTYRKVGRAYILTSDLTGMGARKLKFAAWKSNIDKELDRRQSLWRGQIYTSGTLAKIGFAPNDLMAPDDKTLSAVDSGKKVSTSELTPAMRDFIDHSANRNRQDPLATDKVSIESQVQYTFILPGAPPLLPEAYGLGQHFIFRPSPPAKPEEEIKLESYPAGAAARQRLVVRAESASAVIAAANQAKAHGFTQMWLETHQSSALLTALSQGLKVSLIIRPWQAPSDLRISDPDVNILGDTGLQLAARRAEEPDWLSYHKSADGSGVGPPELYNLVSPFDEGLSAIWANLASLAHTAGLAGVVILDTETAGYEPTDTRISWGPMYQEWLAVLNEFGYSEQLRLGFIQEHGVDPIDIATPDIDLDIDISQPFFTDGNLGHYDYRPGNPSLLMQPIPDQWFAYRAEANAKAMKSFTPLFADVRVPMLVMPRCTSVHILPNLFVGAIPWTPGTPFPQFSPNNLPNNPGVATVFTFNEDSSAIAFRDLGWFVKNPKVSFALDVSAVKPDRLGPFLDRWFPRATSQ